MAPVQKEAHQSWTTTGCRTGLLVVLLVGACATASAPAAADCPNASIRAQQRSSFLPDCRATELVSPQLKNGADISGAPSRTRVATQGDAVQFSSLGGFGDVRGGHVATEYMAIRTATRDTSGWATHAITPGDLAAGSVIDVIVSPAESRYMGEFSSDLSAGVFFASNDFTHTSTTVATLPNLALRSDLRVAGAGTYRLVSDCNGCDGPLPAPNPSGQPYLAGTSGDFQRILFESREPLAPGPAPCTPVFFQTSCPIQLYEWAGGVVRFAGWVPPAGETACGPAPLVACVAADNSQAGQGAGNGNYTLNTISADGSRIVSTVNTGGARNAGRLYLRTGNGESDARTVQINASERTTPDTVPADATYWAASADDSKIFFTTTENLTDDDNSAENNADLYEYSVVPDTQGHHLTLISGDQVGTGVNVEGVVDATADGRTVYFISAAQLLPGLPTATDGIRIYRWHDGALQHVAKASLSATQGLKGFAGIGGWSSGWLARMSPDGTRLLFVSQGTDELPHTGAGDSCGGARDEPCAELFLYDATANGGQGSVVCASCAQPDAPASADATFLSSVDKGAAGLTPHLNHPLSDDGRYVFFNTTAALVSEDRDGGLPDAYEFDATTGQLHLLSSGKPDSFGAIFIEANPSGHDVIVATRDRLSPWDIDDNTDLYDMRVDGGIPGPPPAPPACTADTCRPTHSGGVPAPPASSTIPATGNVKHARHAARCPKGKVRRRVHGKRRCVRRHRHHRHHARVRRAIGERGVGR